MAIKAKTRKAYTLSLDVELMEELDMFCDIERRTRSSAIELAVEMYLKKARDNKEDEK